MRRCDDCARKADRGGFVPIGEYIARHRRMLCLGCLARRRWRGEVWVPAKLTHTDDRVQA